MRSPRLRLRVGLVALVSVLFVTGCAEHVTQTPIEGEDNPQDFLEPIGRYAVELDSLWNIVFWIAVVVFFLVWGLLLVAILRFRQRQDDEGLLPKQVHGNPRLEAMWTVIPALILAVIAVPTVRTIFDLADTPDVDFESPEASGEESLLVSVVGHQFWWEYEYPQYSDGENELVTANILYIPVGREVLLEMTSADVIHSYWIPKLNGKQDVVPGKENRLKLYTDEPGEYLGQCAEFCGLSHANMRARVVALEESEFEQWASQQASPQEDPSDQLAVEGQQLFEQYCVACHQVRGFAEGARIGPDLTYFADREWFAGAIFENDIDGDASNIRSWLANPPLMKPMRPGIGIGMPDLGLEEQEIESLVAYLRTLRSDGDAEGGGAGADDGGDAGDGAGDDGGEGTDGS